MRQIFQLTLGLLVSAAALVPSTASAAGSQTSATGKGIVGGALLGGETVMLVEAAAGTRPAWAYLLGGGLGAVGGGVGGAVAESNHDARLSLYMLVGGMALVIPTTVAVLSASQYQPTNYQEDRPPVDEPVAEPAQPATAPAVPEPPAAAPAPSPSDAAPAPAAPAPAPATPAPAPPSGRVEHPASTTVAAHAAPAAPAAPALVDVARGTLSLSVPAVEVRQMYTRTEIALYGVKQHTEVEVPVFNVTF